MFFVQQTVSPAVTFYIRQVTSHTFLACLSQLFYYSSAVSSLVTRSATRQGDPIPISSNMEMFIVKAAARLF